MEITLIDNVSKSELAEIKKMIGEAFITNELFHEFGDINDRKELVMHIAKLNGRVCGAKRPHSVFEQSICYLPV